MIGMAITNGEDRATVMLLCQGGGKLVDDEAVESAGESSFEAPPDLALCRPSSVRRAM